MNDDFQVVNVAVAGNWMQPDDLYSLVDLTPHPIDNGGLRRSSASNGSAALITISPVEDILEVLDLLFGVVGIVGRLVSALRRGWEFAVTKSSGATPSG